MQDPGPRTTRRPENTLAPPPPHPVSLLSLAMNLIDDLQWRGLLADCTDLAALSQRVAEGPVTL